MIDEKIWITDLKRLLWKGPIKDLMRIAQLNLICG